jgi:ABC-type taurine transport system ATPase subunit
MADYVFTLRTVRKAHGDKVVLDNVTLSFLHGAKIGVVGPNGTGKSSLLKIMAGLDHANNGDAILDPDATVGMLQQEPPLSEGKTVLENVEEAVGELAPGLHGVPRRLAVGPVGALLVEVARGDAEPELGDRRLAGEPVAHLAAQPAAQGHVGLVHRWVS